MIDYLVTGFTQNIFWSLDLEVVPHYLYYR
jgi:hypothetical protein